MNYNTFEMYEKLFGMALHPEKQTRTYYFWTWHPIEERRFEVQNSWGKSEFSKYERVRVTTEDYLLYLNKPIVVMSHHNREEISIPYEVLLFGEKHVLVPANMLISQEEYEKDPFFYDYNIRPSWAPSLTLK